MKVQCTKCKAAYNIDDSKIPEKGASVTCPKCKTRFHIKKEPPAQQKEEVKEELILPCPKCGHINVSTDTCVKCGAAFSAEEKDKIKIPLKLDE